MESIIHRIDKLNKLSQTRFSQIAAAPAPVRILAFLLLLGLLWLPLAVLIVGLGRDANQTTIWTMGLLFVGFVLLIRHWGRWLHGDAQILQTYGLVWNAPNGRDCLTGLGLGLAAVLLLFGFQGLVGWLTWQAPQGFQFGRVLLEGLLVGLGVGLAEELVFRGWILDELERDYNPQVALGASSLLFAVLHFLKPLPEAIRSFPQFPGLVLLGLILVWMKRLTRSQRRTSVSLTTQPGRLGLPIGFHAGLVWGYYLVQVGKLTLATGSAPAWVTGIDGNPLAGAAGLFLLSGLAFYWRRRARR
jgi:uncharacterized protein